MHHQGANVPFNLTSGEFRKAGTFSPSFPDGAEWSRASAGNPPEGTNLCSPLPTPRRKLSLDALDDITQSPFRTESIDSAFNEEASLPSPDKENIFSPGVDFPPISKSSYRRPFGAINCDMTCSPGTRRQLYARRPKAQKKLSLSLSNDRCPPHITRPLSLPVDLKASPFLGQINSPLERMSLFSPCTSRSSSSQLSVHSSESDGYGSDVFDSMELAEANPAIPKTISDLINAPLAGEFTSAMDVSSCSMDQHHHVLCQLESDYVMRQRRGSIKRSNEPSEEHTSKRQMPFFHSSESCPFPSPPEKSFTPTRLQSSSSTSANIFPTSPGDDEVAMIGDHSKPYVLPLIQGSQPDQNSISPDTLVSLIQGEYSDLVDQYTIIDCRYPFEYRGGHIKDSVNIWDKDSLLSSFFDYPTHPLEGKRQIIIFHCEFSSKRGPNMSRFMRKTDRERNGMDFPKLFYPELYLLEGGYRAFFGQHPNHCDPCAYLQMKDDRYQEEAKHFSRRSKSWSEGGGRRPLLRPRLATVGSVAHTNK